MVRLLKRGALASALLVGAEAAYAVLRPAPDLEQFDPSGEFGDDGLPALTVAALGDSSITAPGVAGPEEIWLTILCRRLAAERRVVLRSFAVGGSRAEDLIRDQLEPAIASNPDLVFVSVGGNDVIKGVSRGRFAANLDHLISRLVLTGAVIVQSGVGDLGSIPRLYPPLSNFFTTRSRAFDRVHREVAARHRTHVVVPRHNTETMWYRDRSLWAADLFHVSAAGHRVWADRTWETVEPLLTHPDGRV